MVFCLALSLFGQEIGGEEPGPQDPVPAAGFAAETGATGTDLTAPAAGFAAETTAAELPRGFNRLQLGMSLAEAKEELKADGNFVYRGDPDVSMLRSPNDSLIECEGFYYIDRASFQFVDDGLFTITLIFNQRTLGYYTLYSTLAGKYGDPDELSPEKAVWENEEVIMSLERPLRIKYIAKPVLEELRRESEKGISLEGLGRERFLEQF